MASLLSSSARHHAMKVPTSPAGSMSRDRSGFFASSKRTIQLKLSHTPSQAEISSIPVTPDPNSSSKNSRSKSNKSSKTASPNSKERKDCGHTRLNKFVRRLYDMLIGEKHSGIVEWRRGLLVLFSTDAFSKKILPKYFNTRNFKTFRRQLNYYGFVHVRSFSATGNTTTALWINQHLAEDEANNDVSAVLKLRRVEPDEVAKTVEGRRLRKELAIHTVEEDIGLNSKTLQLDQIRSMAIRGEELCEGHTAILAHDGSMIGTVGKAPEEETLRATEEPNKSSSNSASAIHYANYSSNDDESAGFESALSSSRREEIANTDAAASVLLMLSRS
mmetsp:Transcript_13327/g.31163  ORF Transcript_13327/g.31163 Transcript_13327/m.31163 type:complete len:332 (+) Transcript_13327:468-1463(+)